MPWSKLLAQFPTPTMPTAIFPILFVSSRAPSSRQRVVAASYTQRGAACKRPATRPPPDISQYLGWMLPRGQRSRRPLGGHHHALGELAEDPGHRVARVRGDERDAAIAAFANGGD